MMRNHLRRVHSKLIYTSFFRNLSTGMSKKALVLLSEGSEEMEFVISADVLRRAGIEVTVAGVQGNGPLECSRKVKIQPDVALDASIGKGNFDVIVLPGGLKGAEAFCQSKTVGQLLKDQESSGRVIAAICAAPTALKAHNIAEGKNVTSYPAMEKDMVEGGKYKYLQDKVVVDGNLITSRGPGTAFDFALTIVDKLLGKEKASEVAKGMLLQY